MTRFTRSFRPAPATTCRSSARCSCADGAHRDAGGPGPDRLFGRPCGGHEASGRRRLPARVRQAFGPASASQRARRDHPHLLAHDSALRQRDEWRVHHRDRARAGGASGADPPHGSRAAHRPHSGLHLHDALGRFHRGRRDNHGKEWHMTIEIISIIGAVVAVSFGAIGPALAEGRAVAAAMEAMARQPESAPALSRTLFVGLAMIETMAIYCLVIALLILFANPFVHAR